MKKKYLVKSSAVLLAMIMLFNACGKEKESSAQNDESKVSVTEAADAETKASAQDAGKENAEESAGNGTEEEKADGNGTKEAGETKNVNAESTDKDEESPDEDAAEITEDGSDSAGNKEIVIMDASADNTALSAADSSVKIGNKEIELSGAYVVDGTEAVICGGRYESDSSDQNVFLVINGGSLTISNAEIVKSGDASVNDSKRSSDVSDAYNFYGINSVVLVVGEGSTVNIKDCTITSDCSGANALFATAGGELDADNVKIETSGNSSRGVYATYEGVINAVNMDITTSGAHCAPIATDRGGGCVNVKDSTVKCSGDGSPCIYSTGEITAENVTGISEGAQAAVIEGKNSISMTDCSFTTTGGNNGVMLYQSMSGDASDKDATASVSTLSMSGTSINNEGDGPMFYITNTSSVINLNGGNTLTNAGKVLVNAATGRWGSDGSNGGELTLIIDGDTIEDSVEADDISAVKVSVHSGEFSGSTSGDVTVE